MISVLRLTARELIHRRMGLVVCGLTLVLPALLILSNQVQRDASGIFHGGHGLTLELQVQTVFEATLRMCSQIWSLIAAIAAALLFTSFLERGWAELLLTKAQRRWTFLCTRFAAATAIYTVSVIVMLLILAAYYGRAGWELIPHGMWRSVLLITVSFAALTSTAVLLAFSRSGMALPIFGVFLQLILSSIFAQHEMLKRAIDSDLGRKAIDLAYWVIPKHSELERMANSAIRETPIINTPQLWCTVAYTLATLLVSIAWFQRKSF